jgi:hypothetical protein
MDRRELSKSQKEFGVEQITKFANRHKISYQQAIAIIEDGPYLASMWNWVNMSQFLKDTANKKIHSERKMRDDDR